MHATPFMIGIRHCGFGFGLALAFDFGFDFGFGFGCGYGFGLVLALGFGFISTGPAKGVVVANVLTAEHLIRGTEQV